MDANTKFDMSPRAMEPLFPDGEINKLENLAIELIRKASRLEGATNPITRIALADFLRPMNSYYSNLIEGHDTHPIDIAKALKNDYSTDKTKRDLQLEAQAHIALYKEIGIEINNANLNYIPSSTNYIKNIHKRFYDYLPDDFKEVKSIEGVKKYVMPGELRVDEVKVGRHIAPYSVELAKFMDRFEKK